MGMSCLCSRAHLAQLRDERKKLREVETPASSSTQVPAEVGAEKSATRLPPPARPFSSLC